MAKQDLFLDLKGIEGESKDTGQPNTIQLDSFGFSGNSPRDVATHQAVGKVVMTPLSCTKPTDKASPKLFAAMWKNQKIDKATLIVRKSGKTQVEYLKYELEEVFVSSVSVSGSAGDNAPIPIETFSLVYGKITVIYKEQKPDGTLGGTVQESLDLRQNRPGG